MRLSELITAVREAASVNTANRWNDAAVARLINVQHRSLVRKTVEVNQRFHNYTFQLAASAGRTKHTDIITYRLPPWVMKVAAVRQSSTTPTTMGQRDNIPRLDQHWTRGGWEHSATGEFQLVGYSTALDLELEVAKLPALLTKGTLPNQSGVTTSQMKLDSDSSADALQFPHESVKDAYAGALFEITGPASARKGQLLRCVGSLPNQSTDQHLLTMEEAWTSAPASADTYEMHAELGAEHCHLLTLLAARSLLSQERNVQGVAAYSQEIGEQWSLYVQHIAERDQAGPHLVVESIGGPRRDLNSVYDLEAS